MNRWIDAYAKADSSAYWAIIRLNAYLSNPPPSMAADDREWLEETARLLRQGLDEAHGIAYPDQQQQREAAQSAARRTL